jgi:hypothetical protein
MKPSPFSMVLLIAVNALLWFNPAATASSISFVDQFKNVSFLQTGNGNTLTGNGAFYSAELIATAADAYTSAMLTYPGAGSPVALTQLLPAAGDYRYETPSLLANKAAMDAAFPFGVYTFEGTGSAGTDIAGYNYTADDYALSNPFLTGTDYAGLQGMNPSQPFTFHLSPYLTGSNANFSFIFLTIFDFTSNTFVYSNGFLPPTTTSITLPANTLSFGHSFVYELNYDNRDVLEGTGSAAFSPELGFDTRSDGTFSTATAPVPEPSTALLLGFGLFAALGFCSRRRGNLVGAGSATLHRRGQVDRQVR